MEKQKGFETLNYWDHAGTVASDIEKIKSYFWRGYGQAETIFAVLLEKGINQLKTDPRFADIWKEQ